jgi:hypothetical protein
MGEVNSVKISLGGSDTIALSERRIQALLEGNTTAARKMGWFDRLTDTVFHDGAKQTALQAMAEAFENAQGLDALGRFTMLSWFVRPQDRAQFTVTVEGEAGQEQLKFRIQGHEVKSVTEGIDLNTVRARLAEVPGETVGAHRHAANWLAPYERQDLEAARRTVQDEAFNAGGGKHKRFDPASGVLRAQDHTGAEDFKKELEVDRLAQSSPELARYVSTQRVLNASEMREQLPGIQSDRPHAVVRLYDPAHVHSGELDARIDKLGSAQAQAVAMQVVDMARVFFNVRVAHHDLHMHNLMVHTPVGQDSHITLQAIDFGKSSVNASFDDRIKDLRYLFNCESPTGVAEDAWRALRDTWDGGAGLNKHFPLHKLLQRCWTAEGGRPSADSGGDFDASLAAVGDRLVEALVQAQGQHEEGSPAYEKAANAAFNAAMQSVGLMAENLRRPPQAEMVYMLRA